MPAEVSRCLFDYVWVILKAPKAIIARRAKKSPNNVCVMSMIYSKPYSSLVWISTDRTHAILLLNHSFIKLNSKSIFF